MHDVLPTLARWEEEGQRFAVAMVVAISGSSPRPLGSLMGIREDGLICGSVSGGCVESTVIEAGLGCLASGEGRSLSFSGAGDVWEVGLSCGGQIEVWVFPGSGIWRTVLGAKRPAVLSTRLIPFEQTVGSISEEGVFQLPLPLRERLVIVGAVHIAVPLVSFAKALGFETIVVDPRSTFADDERFPVSPDALLAVWPREFFVSYEVTEETYAVVLTHDPKIDDEALAVLLKSPAAYIGALGSRTTQAQRRATFLAQGFSPEEVERIHGPVGLDIGARTPEEIAVSIVAEIVRVRNAR